MYENLMDEAVGSENYGKALRKVIDNQCAFKSCAKGAPGIDGMKTNALSTLAPEELNGHLLKHWPKIHWRKS